MLRARALDAVCLLALAGVLAFGHSRLGGVAAIDPDRNYHLALSRAAAEHGRLTELPQLPDIGWDKKFVDKEYLFHVFTTWAWRAGAERGVELLMFALAFLTCAALYALCRVGAGPLPSLAFASAGALANEWLMYRLLMMRPQVLAIGLALTVAVAMLRRMPVLAAVAAAAFALSYHAFYVPLALAALTLVCAPKDRTGWRTAAAAAAGLVLGTLINPYFPGTIGMALVGLKVGTAKVDDAGTELAPLATRLFVTRFGVPLALVVVTALRPWLAPFATPEQRARVMTLGLGAATFWLLAALTPRAAEYAVPLSAAAAAHALADLSVRWQGAVAAVALLFHAPRLEEPRSLCAGDQYAFAIVPAAATIPPGPGKKVLNCSFEEGEILLWARPDLKAVDVLDPIFLRQAAPELAQLREDFRQGHVFDAKAVVRGSFQADYVMCGYPGANAMLEADPRFARLNPPPGSPADPSAHSVYALIDEPIPALRRFDVLSGQMHRQLNAPGFTDLLNLSRWPFDRDGCVRLGVPADELKRRAGAQVAVLGGGPRVDLEIDGKPVASLEAPEKQLRWNALLVPLEAPIAEQRVELKVCANGTTSAGLSLSLWTWADIERWCTRRAQPLAAASGVAVNGERATCLAPLAARRER